MGEFYLTRIFARQMWHYVITEKGPLKTRPPQHICHTNMPDSNAGIYSEQDTIVGVCGKWCLSRPTEWMFYPRWACTVVVHVPAFLPYIYGRNAPIGFKFSCWAIHSQTRPPAHIFHTNAWQLCRYTVNRIRCSYRFKFGITACKMMRGMHIYNMLQNLIWGSTIANQASTNLCVGTTQCQFSSSTITWHKWHHTHSQLDCMTGWRKQRNSQSSHG